MAPKGCQSAIGGFFWIKKLCFCSTNLHFLQMGAPQQPISLTPEEIEEINTALSDTRHNVNNHIPLIAGAIALIKRKSEATEKCLTSLAQQPDKIQDEMRDFSDKFEKLLQITRD